MCTNLKNLIKKPLRKGVKYNTLIRMERRKKFRETKGHILGDNKITCSESSLDQKTSVWNSPLDPQSLHFQNVKHLYSKLKTY